MKVIYPSAKDFYSFINSITKVTDNVVLNFTEDGIFSKYLTDDKVLMALMKISKEVLSEYTIEKSTAFKLEATALKKIMAKIKSKKAIIEINETDNGLKFVIRDEKSGIRSNIYVKAEKIEVEQLSEPKVNLSVTFSVDGKILDTITGDAALIGEEIRLSTKEDKIEIEVDEGGRKYTAFLEKDKSLKELIIDSAASASYSVEMFKLAVTALRDFSSPITISFGTNLPLKLVTEAPAGGYMTFWIAPRL
ncbi:MAG: DNA polymerase sliding clamp [Saccharolobus sp.]